MINCKQENIFISYSLQSFTKWIFIFRLEKEDPKQKLCFCSSFLFFLLTLRSFNIFPHCSGLSCLSITIVMSSYPLVSWFNLISLSNSLDWQLSEQRFHNKIRTNSDFFIFFSLNFSRIRQQRSSLAHIFSTTVTASLADRAGV